MKRTLQGLLSTVALLLGIGQLWGQGPQRPNVLVLLADQWRAQAFGYAGDPNVQTPHLDRLQQQALWCRNAISSVPVCCPARASLLSGQRALSHGVFLNDVPLDPKALTLAKVLAKAGYATGYIGKWHLDGHGRSSFIPPERRQGFDYWKALECTHDYNHSFYYGQGPQKLLWAGYDAFAQTLDAQEYLRERARTNQPFFLFVSWGPPHSPYQTAPPQYQAKYQPAQMQLRPNVPAALRQKARKALAGYYAHCSALDECVGQLLATLRQSGLESNTLVVFSSDHGDLLGSQGAFDKQQPYEESVHVPLLLRWPQGLGSTARQLDEPISSEDLMPTLLGLCNLDIPKSVEGLDFSDYLRGGKAPADGAALLACPAPFGQWTRAQGGREYRGLRTRRYTYVRELKGPWLLFDNQSDPYQLTNLVNLAQSRPLQAELEAALAAKLKASHDEFLPAQAYISQRGYRVDTNGTVPYTN